MITIHRYIIHEVHKELKVPGAALEPSDRIADIDAFAMKLVDDTHQSFADSSSLRNTRFEEGHSTVFLTGLTNYLGDNSDPNFYNYSVNSLTDLRDKIENEPFAVGGYYLFADYEAEGRRYISAVLLRKKSGVNFQKVHGIYKAVDGENINIEKIAMGFRLNHAIYTEADPEHNYVALVTNQQDKVSNYFKQWVQAAGIISPDKNTSALVKILNSIPLPTDETNTPLYETREDFKRACYDIIEESPKKMVNLHQISQHFYGIEQRQFILQYAQNNQIIIDPEFKRTPKVLKKLITIRAKVPGIELNVDYDKLNEAEVDVLDDKIVIHSQSLVEEVNRLKNEQ